MLPKEREPTGNSNRSEDYSTGFITYCAYKRIMSDITNTMKKREMLQTKWQQEKNTQAGPPGKGHGRESERAESENRVLEHE